MILEAVQALLQEALPQAFPVALVQAFFIRMVRHCRFGSQGVEAKGVYSFGVTPRILP